MQRGESDPNYRATFKISEPISTTRPICDCEEAVIAGSIGLPQRASSSWTLWQNADSTLADGLIRTRRNTFHPERSVEVVDDGSLLEGGLVVVQRLERVRQRHVVGRLKAPAVAKAENYHRLPSAPFIHPFTFTSCQAGSIHHWTKNQRTPLPAERTRIEVSCTAVSRLNYSSNRAVSDKDSRRLQDSRRNATTAIPTHIYRTWLQLL